MVILTNLPTDWLHGSLAAFFTTWSTPIRCQAAAVHKKCMLSLYLGLTCLLHRLESLLKVKVCHLMYAASSRCSWAVLGTGDYINYTDMQCGNSLLSVVVWMCAALSMVPLAPRQLMPEHLHGEPCFALSLKTHMGCGGTEVLHVCHTRSKTRPKLCEAIATTCSVSVGAVSEFQDML